MIKKCQNKDKIELLNYIGNDYDRCLYLYLDLIEYGCENPAIKVWIQKDELSIQAVILKYHTGMHIFSKDYRINYEEIKNIINEETPSIICGEPETIHKLNNGKYYSETGWIRKLSNTEKLDNVTDGVKKAKPEDFDRIAELLINDEDMGASYSFNELKDQLLERNIEGYSRNYVIYENNIIVSHVATSAENENIAMVSYVVTDNNYRRKGYAKRVCSNMCKDLVSEGKSVFLVNYTDDSTALYDKMGFEICCNWEKLVLKK